MSVVPARPRAGEFASSPRFPPLARLVGPCERRNQAPPWFYAFASKGR